MPAANGNWASIDIQTKSESDKAIVGDDWGGVSRKKKEIPALWDNISKWKKFQTADPFNSFSLIDDTREGIFKKE